MNKHKLKYTTEGGKGWSLLTREGKVHLCEEIMSKLGAVPGKNGTLTVCMEEPKQKGFEEVTLRKPGAYWQWKIEGVEDKGGDGYFSGDAEERMFNTMSKNLAPFTIWIKVEVDK